MKKSNIMAIAMASLLMLASCQKGEEQPAANSSMSAASSTTPSSATTETPIEDLVVGSVKIERFASSLEKERIINGALSEIRSSLLSAKTDEYMSQLLTPRLSRAMKFSNIVKGYEDGLELTSHSSEYEIWGESTILVDDLEETLSTFVSEDYELTKAYGSKYGKLSNVVSTISPGYQADFADVIYDYSVGSESEINLADQLQYLDIGYTKEGELYGFMFNEDFEIDSNSTIVNESTYFNEVESTITMDLLVKFDASNGYRMLELIGDYAVEANAVGFYDFGEYRTVEEQKFHVAFDYGTRGKGYPSMESSLSSYATDADLTISLYDVEKDEDGNIASLSTDDITYLADSESYYEGQQTFVREGVINKTIKAGEIFTLDKYAEARQLNKEDFEYNNEFMDGMIEDELFDEEAFENGLLEKVEFEERTYYKAVVDVTLSVGATAKATIGSELQYEVSFDRLEVKAK